MALKIGIGSGNGNEGPLNVFETLSFGYILSGFGVGTLVGLTGVGGGSLMTPVLVLLFGIHPTTAVGTDLLFASVTKTLGTTVHGFAGTVEWRVTRRLALGSLPASLVTLWILSQGSGCESGACSLTSFILGIALLLTAAAVLMRRQIQRFAAAHMPDLPDLWTAGLTVVTGIILGILVTISSVGAGALGVTALYFLYPRLPTARIVGSDIAHAVPLTLLAGLGHWLTGSIDFEVLGLLLTGSLPGVVIGSLISSRIRDGVLRPILAAVLLLVGGRLVATCTPNGTCHAVTAPQRSAEMPSRTGVSPARFAHQGSLRSSIILD
jgi:uncharacterized membrane protein YfcA